MDDRSRATDSTIGNVHPFRSSADEFANWLTHGAGLLLSLAGAGVMIPATRDSNAGIRLAVMAYVASLVAVYGISTLSHVVQSTAEKHRLQAWDQGTIYFLIVGTYTPFIAIYLAPPQAAMLVTGLWILAGLGFWSKVIANYRIQAFSAWSYIALGWFPAMAFVGRVPSACILWMALGGISYTVGTLFLMLDRHVRFFHAIWHMLVIFASACHYYAIFAYVVD